MGEAGQGAAVRRVALTGGIATGKSHVRAAFERLGAPTIDADVLARQAVRPGSPGLAAVVAAGVRVIAVPAAGANVEDSIGAASTVLGGDGALVILATNPQAAQRLAAAAVTSSLSAIVRVG